MSTTFYDALNPKPQTPNPEVESPDHVSAEDVQHGLQRGRRRSHYKVHV